MASVDRLKPVSPGRYECPSILILTGILPTLVFRHIGFPVDTSLNHCFVEIQVVFEICFLKLYRHLLWQWQVEKYTFVKHLCPFLLDFKIDSCELDHDMLAKSSCKISFATNWKLILKKTKPLLQGLLPSGNKIEEWNYYALSSFKLFFWENF